MANVMEMLSFLNELQVINDIIEHSENIIFAKDVDGRYTLANNASIKYFGKTKPEVIGKTDEQIFSEEEGGFNKEMDRVVLSGGKKRSYEKEREGPDGETVYFYVTKDIVKDKIGRTVGVSGTVVDITEYKHEQQQLSAIKEKARMLKIANKVKYDFMKNLSHNLRTPLMGILGASVMNMNDTDLLGTYRKDLELFRYSAELLLNIVNEMIEFEPLIYHDIKLVSKPFRVASLVRFIEQLFSHICQESGVRFSCNSELDASLTADGDFHKLLQVVTKTLVFTLRFTPMKSKVSVKFDSEGPAPAEGHARFRCTIDSTGPPISAEVASRMFQAYSEDVDEKDILEHSNALGLELYIVRRIMTAFGGTIDYDVRGSYGVFTIACDLKVTDSLGPRPAPGLATVSVLVADDNKINQAVLRKMLQRLNVKEIVVVGDGRKAVTAFRERHEARDPFNLVLMDLQMPELNGMEATREIRDYERAKGVTPVQVLAVTAFVTDQDRQDCFDAGMDGFLGKPVTQSLLTDIIVDMKI